MLTRLAIALSIFTAAAPQAFGATDDELYAARNHLRCAAFYISGSAAVASDELRQQLQDLASVRLQQVEQLMDGDRTRVKTEFDTAREKFNAEIATDEVKADPRGFLNYMGHLCARMR